MVTPISQVWELRGSTPCQNNTQGLKNLWGEGAAFISHLQMASQTL